MHEDQMQPMPPSVTLSLLFAGKPVCSLPVFLLVMLAEQQDRNNHRHQLFNRMKVAPDLIAGDTEDNQSPYIACLQEMIPARDVIPFMSCPSYLRETLATMWSQHIQDYGSFTLRFVHKLFPEVIYRYMPYRQDRIEALLRQGTLFFPCPAQFNDPFDCGLDEAGRLTFIECAMACFSTLPRNILMFSHYADNHRGICVGFKTETLISSLMTRNAPVGAQIRPVWYFRKMPKLNLQTAPALCATCKHDIWSYEHEFRVFMTNGGSLVPSGSYGFDRSAISEVICGCRATDDTVAACKTLTADLPSCTRKKAVQMPGRFGVYPHAIHRI